MSDRNYVWRDRFTAADISIGYALMLAEYLKFSDSFRPATAAYWQRLRAREGVKRALAAEVAAAGQQGVPPTPVPLVD